jgi:hypothetical protein
MANFFSYFPKLQYTTSSVVVDILSRIGIRDNYTNKDELFYNYVVQDNDTPENIAAKYYGDSGKHWVIMLFNNFSDPLYDFPMDYYTFEKYLNKKYYNEGLAINRLGVEYSQITQNPDPFAYRITINTSQPQLSIYNNITSSDIITSEPEIYYNSANIALNVSTTSITFGTITQTTKVEQIMIYDWEFKLNEDKRIIKLLKKEYAINIEQELKKLS